MLPPRLVRRLALVPLVAVITFAFIVLFSFPALPAWRTDLLRESSSVV